MFLPGFVLGKMSNAKFFTTKEFWTLVLTENEEK